jgi:hypothetical protein
VHDTRNIWACVQAEIAAGRYVETENGYARADLSPEEIRTADLWAETMNGLQHEYALATDDATKEFIESQMFDLETAVQALVKPRHGADALEQDAASKQGGGLGESVDDDHDMDSMHDKVDTEDTKADAGDQRDDDEDNSLENDEVLESTNSIDGKPLSLDKVCNFVYPMLGSSPVIIFMTRAGTSLDLVVPSEDLI